MTEIKPIHPRYAWFALITSFVWVPSIYILLLEDQLYLPAYFGIAASIAISLFIHFESILIHNERLSIRRYGVVIDDSNLRECQVIVDQSGIFGSELKIHKGRKISTVIALSNYSESDQKLLLELIER